MSISGQKVLIEKWSQKSTENRISKSISKPQKSPDFELLILARRAAFNEENHLPKPDRQKR
jgi:hypothetical protein